MRRKAGLTTHQKRTKIIAHDIVAILDDADNCDYEFLYMMLTGTGTSPAIGWNKKRVEEEWREGEYDGPAKDKLVRSSRHYHIVKEMWEVTNNG